MISEEYVGMLLVGIIIVASLVTARVATLRFRQRKLERENLHVPVKIKRDWMPTGNINFIVPSENGGEYEQEGNFVLELEEERIVELIGGGETKEIRFRMANLREAKSVATAYQDRIKDNLEDRIVRNPGKEKQPRPALQQLISSQGELMKVQ